MEITKGEIKSMGPCREGWEWYLDHQIEDLRALVLTVNSAEDAIDEDGEFAGTAWAWWILKNVLADKKEISVKVAIFAARIVLENWVKKFPEDDRVLNAIEAAEDWLENPSQRNASAAWSAEFAAWSAESAARSAGASIQEQILNYAVDLLEAE